MKVFVLWTLGQEKFLWCCFNFILHFQVNKVFDFFFVENFQHFFLDLEWKHSDIISPKCILRVRRDSIGVFWNFRERFSILWTPREKSLVLSKLPSIWPLDNIDQNVLVKFSSFSRTLSTSNKIFRVVLSRQHSTCPEELTELPFWVEYEKTFISLPFLFKFFWTWFEKRWKSSRNFQFLFWVAENTILLVLSKLTKSVSYVTVGKNECFFSQTLINKTQTKAQKA